MAVRMGSADVPLYAKSKQESQYASPWLITKQSVHQVLIKSADGVCELGLIDRIHDFQHHLQEQLFLQVYGSITIP